LDIGKFLSSDGTWKHAGYDIDFIGATENTNGVHGLVPAPLAGQESYYLRADGTWAEVQGGKTYAEGEAIKFEYETVVSGDAVTHVKWSLLQTRGRKAGTSDNCIQVREFEMRNINDELISFKSNVTGVFDPSSTTPVYGSSQTPDALVDGTSRKMCCTNFTSSITEFIFTMELTTPVPMNRIKDYRYITGEDEPNRDPVSWVLYVSIDGTNYIEVDRRIDQTITQSRSTGTSYYTPSFPSTLSTTVNVQYGDGLEVDNDNDLNVKLGSGLQFDANGAIEAPGSRTYVAGDGIVITDNSSFELSEDTVRNTEYFFDTRVTSSVLGRTYTKYNTEPALGAVVYFSSGYTQPYFVGLTADSVKYGTDWDSQISPNPDHPTFEYKGVTWYYSGGQYAMRGDGTDTSGHIQKISGSYPASTEADFQNIARAIIDAADIITSPTKVVSAKIGEGLSFDSNDAIQNEGLLSVTQDFDDKNRLTFGTTYGDIIIDIPTGGGGDSSETYVAGDAVSLHNSTAPLTAPLTHFKWEISQTRAKAEGTVYVTLQVNEIEFYDENDQLITFSAIAGSFKSNSPNPPSPSYATTPTVQTPDKIIDNDITTKCCVTNFTSELDAMVFIFELDSTNPITAQDIKCYRYYTADNDTSADPVTWTLSVSPDGIEWFVVDTQTEFNAPTARETSTDYFTMTKPTIPAKSINVKYNDGLMLDANGNLVVQTGQGIEISNNAVTAKLGVGLTFDNIDAITLDETIDLALNCDYSQ
jgi:hypothetical protein